MRDYERTCYPRGAMARIIGCLSLPLIILNMIGGLISGVWLLLLGEWWALGIGFLGLFSHLPLSFVLLPSLALAVPGVRALEDGKPWAALPFLLLGKVYTYAVVTIWCVFVMWVFLGKAEARSVWPIVIWSYGVALGPWNYMASKEDQTVDLGGGSSMPSSAIMTSVTAAIAYFIVLAVSLFKQLAFVEALLVFGGCMLVGAAPQTAIALRELRQVGAEPPDLMSPESPRQRVYAGPIRDATPTVFAAARPIMEGEPLECPACGTLNEPTATHCDCGTPLR